MGRGPHPVTEGVRDLLRLEALGLMTAGIVHDLGNMIQVLASAVNIVERHPEVRGSAALQPVVAAAIDSLDRAGGTVRQILGFVREDAATAEPIDVALALAGMERLLRWLCPHPVGLTLQLDAVLPTLICNRHKFENAILNLVLNARDAMPEGGRLTVSASAEPAHLVIAVSDTGTGMTPAVAAAAFEPMFTTKPEGRGTGLGLPMVRQFARELSGSATIASQPEQGTTVTLHLPIPVVRESDAA
ncbi:ATP-binding protein [Sphingomonas gei]|uniref:histidine kinase n=1 Tax=Sphingomonas gei TaxID=1395960 RepID=A0A4S1XIU3_9SPHN|nr:ATP-binding protein [Sphingomonas gei]TGX55733.1 ATP-binding protein [Sphingomonas gei]